MRNIAGIPDSQLPFKGYQIPEWEALLKLAEEIHRTKMPNYPYIGWDFALTPKGWVLIEGNWGEMSMPQIEFGKGLYKEFADLLHDDN